MTKLVIKLIAIFAVLAILVIADLVYADQKQKLVDPTLPKDNIVTRVVTEQQGNLNLTTILISNNGNSVIINNQLLQEQDQVAQYKIITIKPNKVTLIDDTENIIELELLQNNLTKELIEIKKND